MKPDIHPEMHPVLFVDGEHEWVARSTMTSEETREIDGVEHYVVRLEISRHTHPFFTGRQKYVDTAGRIERFRRKYRGGERPEEEEKKAAEAEEEAAEKAPSRS